MKHALVSLVITNVISILKDSRLPIVWTGPGRGPMGFLDIRSWALQGAVWYVFYDAIYALLLPPSKDGAMRFPSQMNIPIYNT